MEFAGFVQLEDDVTIFLQCLDSDHSPENPDAAPTFRVFGASGLLASAVGTFAAVHTGEITDATNASPIVVTSASHGLQTGQKVTISGVVGNTAANGTFVVTRVGADTFSLNGSTGNAGYTSGGEFTVTGFYSATVSATGANAFEAGETFAVHASWKVSGSARAKVFGLSVT